MYKIKQAAMLGAVLCGLTPLMAKAQSSCETPFSFRIVELQTNEPVPGAIVSIGQKQTATDADGFGSMENVCPGKVHLHVESIGYEKFDKDLNFAVGDTLKIVIRSSDLTLDAIEIVGHKQALNTTTSVTTLHQEELDRLKGGNLATILSTIPGVNMLQTGATIGKPVVNGMHSNRLLILNNGVRQEGQQWGAEHAPEIDPFIASNITVVKGAEAIRYGPEAIGGVVIIEPPALPSDSTIHAEVNLVGASNGRSGTASGMLSGNFKKIPELAWRVQGTAKRSGNLQTADYFLDNTGSKESNYSAALGYNKEHMGLDLFFSHFNTELGIFKESHIGSTEDLLAHIANGRPFDNGSFYYNIDAPRQLVKHNLLKANGHIHLNDYLHFNMQYGFQTDNRQEYDVRRAGRSGIPSLNLTLLTHTIDAAMEYYDGKQWKATVGVNGIYQQNKYDATSATLQPIPYYNSTGAGVYFLGKMIKDAYQLEAGIRYDYKYLTAAGYRNDTLYGGRHEFNNVSGSIGIVLPVNHKLNLRSNIGTAWRPPTPNELYSSGLHSAAAAVEYGDSTLASEKSVKWITSIDYSPWKWLRVNADLYANYFDNYIYLSPTGELAERLNGTFPTFQEKQTNARFLGADISANIDVLKKMLVYSLKASFIRAKDISANRYLPNIPADRIENAVKWSPSISSNVVHGSYVQLEHVFVAKQTRYDAGSDFAPPPNAYQLLNLNAGTQFKLHKHNLGVNLSVNNLTNTLYKDYMNRFRYYAHDIGRNVILRVTYRI
jgi:iron complex outermembrane recepter protein